MNPHVFISLTTIDSRVDKVDLTVRSLLAQDYDNLSVVLHLSREPYLLDKGVLHAPPRAGGPSSRRSALQHSLGAEYGPLSQTVAAFGVARFS